MDPVPRRGAAAIEHPDVRHFYDWWSGRARGRAMPHRRDFLAEELARFWPDLTRLEVVRDADRIRIRYRVVGENVAMLNGGNHAGRFMDETLPQHSAARIVAAHLDVVAHGLPLYSRRPSRDARGLDFTFERLIVPVTESDGRADGLLALVLASSAAGDVDLRAAPHPASSEMNYAMRVFIDPGAE